MPAATRLPPVITAAGPLLARYELIICDIWGVLHDGKTAYAQASDVLAAARAAGRRVILVSNAPMPADGVARNLAVKRVRADAYDAIVTSGELSRVIIAQRRWAKVHHIGPARDLPLFDTLHVERVALEGAQAIVCTGLIDDETETAETYRPMLERALERRLPLLCANPDLIVEVGRHMLPCAGVVGELYASLGGTVIWAGKPHGNAYEAALALGEKLARRSIPKSAILAIGDSVRTDLTGAANFGVEALMIAAGIHRHEILTAGAINPDALASLLSPPAPRPIAVMTHLA